MTVGKVGPLTIPYGGGIYFRVLPPFLTNGKLKHHSTANNPLLGYFHPYDIDTEQEHFMHPGINNSKFYNYLMYYNRKKMFTRLNKLTELHLNVMSYTEYITTYIK